MHVCIKSTEKYTGKTIHRLQKIFQLKNRQNFEELLYEKLLIKQSKTELGIKYGSQPFLFICYFLFAQKLILQAAMQSS